MLEVSDERANVGELKIVELEEELKGEQHRKTKYNIYKKKYIYMVLQHYIQS